jgi:glycosyltransferase involved in cell wall biosynthesis
MPSDPRISVIVISRNEGSFLKRTVENLTDTLPASAEIIVVDDGSTDNSCVGIARRGSRVRLLRAKGLGVAKSRNFGVKHTTGKILIFADAHLSLDSGWWRPLTDQLENPRVGAVAPGIANWKDDGLVGWGIRFDGPQMEVKWLRRKPKEPSSVPILPGCCLAMRREVFEHPGGGWDGGLHQRGNVDNEVSVRLWLLGYELLVVPEVVVRHRFRKSSPFPVGWPQYLHNRLRLAFVHFKPDRLATVISSLRQYPGFGEAMALVVDGNIGERRREIISARTRDDDWYFDRFRLHW